MFRICVTNKLMESMQKNYIVMRNHGIKVGLYMCDTDGCNKKYNLKTMQISRNYTIH